MRGLIALSLPLLVASAPSFKAENIREGAAPVLSSTNSEVIPDSYIIVFKDHVTESSAASHHSWVQDIHLTSENERAELRKRSQFPITTDIFEGIKHTYNIAGDFLGYSGHFDDSIIEQVRRHPDVAFVEKDSLVHILDSNEISPGELEKGAPWGLARISHRESLSFSTYNKYIYAAESGEGVDVYVVDTGIYTEHVDFEGRAFWGKTFVPGDPDEDGNGHGTHCSGTIVGAKYGVAKKAHIYGVKVLNAQGSGTMSDVIKGVEFTVESHLKKVEDAKSGKVKGFKGSTANMSLGGGKSLALEIAVNGAVTAGIHFAVAAGNDNADSCRYSPAGAEQAITVGASTLVDERAYFSNYGKCNDIFAPGLDIRSTWIGSKYAVNTISGTSMASPHVAGLLTYFLGLQPASDSGYALPEITPKKMKENLLRIATVGALKDVPSNTRNILAWNGGGSSNYSSIIEKGGYTVTNTPSTDDLVTIKFSSTNEGVEITVKDDSNIASGKIVKATNSMLSKAEKFSKKVQEMLDAELKEFLQEA